MYRYGSEVVKQMLATAWWPRWGRRINNNNYNENGNNKIVIRRPHRGTTAVARVCFTTSPPYRYLSSLSFLTSRDPESLAVKFLSSYLLSFLGSKYLGT